MFSGSITLLKWHPPFVEVMSHEQSTKYTVYLSITNMVGFIIFDSWFLLVKSPKPQLLTMIAWFVGLSKDCFVALVAGPSALIPTITSRRCPVKLVMAEETQVGIWKARDTTWGFWQKLEDSRLKQYQKLRFNWRTWWKILWFLLILPRVSQGFMKYGSSRSSILFPDLWLCFKDQLDLEPTNTRMWILGHQLCVKTYDFPTWMGELWWKSSLVPWFDP